jgi:hypothetical protein
VVPVTSQLLAAHLRATANVQFPAESRASVGSPAPALSFRQLLPIKNATGGAPPWEISLGWGSR